MACSPNTEPGADTLAIFSPSLMTSTAQLGPLDALPQASLQAFSRRPRRQERVKAYLPPSFWDLNKLFDAEIARSSWTEVQLRHTAS
jgi:hypothetical protein